MADTVGFIRRLPTRLVEAFRSTLEETADADLLLHVIDAAAPERDTNIAAVEAVLEEIGAGEVPVLQVFNKVDLFAESGPHVERDERGRPRRVWVSAVTGEGIDLLREAIAERLFADRSRLSLRLPPSAGRLRARLYARNAVESENTADDGSAELVVVMPRSDLDALLRQEGIRAGDVLVEAGGLPASADLQSRALDGEASASRRHTDDGEGHGLE